MSVRTVLIVLLALVFGGSVAFGINTFLKQRRPTQQQQQVVVTVPVVVAADDIARFADLTEDMLRIKQFPRDLVPPGSLGTVTDAANRVTLVSVKAGEALSTTRLSEKGAGRGIAAVIPKGMRAFTINTPNVSSSVAGFVLPGSRVDVIFTTKQIRLDDVTASVSKTTWLKNLEVLAVDQRVEAPTSSKVDIKELRSVTLLVTKEQVEALAKGQSAGTLQLSLRNPEDNSDGKSENYQEIVVNEPLKTKEPVVAPLPPAPTQTPPALIRTIRGVDSGLVELR